MYAYRTPGVHAEWLGAAAGIGLRRTDVAAFVGIAERGPLYEPVRVQSWAEFTGVCGGHLPDAFLAYAVSGFFANEGRTCWVVRVADPESAATATADLPGRGPAALRLTATSQGTWAHRMTVSVAPTTEDRFTLSLRLPDGTAEQWRDLSLDEADPRFAVTVLGESRLAHAERLGGTVPRTAATRFAGGADGLGTLRPEHLAGGLSALEAVDEAAVVAVPDIMSGPFTEGEILRLQTDLVRHCLLRQDRFALLDPRPYDRDPAAVSAWRLRFEGVTLGQWAGLYYPWLRVPDPLAGPGELRDVPPSGHVAGVLARTDLRDGVHKAPANELVEGAYDVVTVVGDRTHGELNDRSVNVIRPWHGRGLRVAGARTLAADPLMRYVNVRRLLSMIEEAIDEQTQWAVFEPNAVTLWRDVDRIVRGFLDDLWRRGMLDGATPEDAYFVRCDDTANTPPDVDAGRLVCLIGIRPPAPAEFVVVRIVRDATTVAFAENTGVPGG